MKDKKEMKTALEYNESGKSKTAIVNAIRREWEVYRPKFVAIQRRVREVVLPNGERKRLVECNDCSGLFPRAQIECHHLTPVGGLSSTSVEDIQAYQDRMFPRASGLVPVCLDCHQKQHQNT